MVNQKMWLNKTTLNSGHSWGRKIIQDKDLIHAYGLNKNLEKLKEYTKPQENEDHPRTFRLINKKK